MFRFRNFGMVAACGLFLSLAASSHATQIELKDTELGKPLVLNEEADYVLRKVVVTGLTDCAAVTLAGRIASAWTRA